MPVSWRREARARANRRRQRHEKRKRNVSGSQKKNYAFAKSVHKALKPDDVPAMISLFLKQFYSDQQFLEAIMTFSPDTDPNICGDIWSFLKEQSEVVINMNDKVFIHSKNRVAALSDLMEHGYVTDYYKDKKEDSGNLLYMALCYKSQECASLLLRLDTIDICDDITNDTVPENIIFKKIVDFQDPHELLHIIFQRGYFAQRSISPGECFQLIKASAHVKAMDMFEFFLKKFVKMAESGINTIVSHKSNQAGGTVLHSVAEVGFFPGMQYILQIFPDVQMIACTKSWRSTYDVAFEANEQCWQMLETHFGPEFAESCSTPT